MPHNRPLWIFGENRGTTMSDNSWHAFRRVASRSDLYPVRARFVLTPTREHRALCAKIPLHLRRGIVWRGSSAHRRVFDQADRFLITLSFQDIEPPQVAGRSTRRVPLVHLQHGTIGIKKVGYHGSYYRNTIDAFCVYTDGEGALLQQHNAFAPEQLFRLSHPPRYGALLQTQQRIPIRPGEILWFLTWRDYLDDDVVTIPELRRGARAFVDTVVRTLTSTRLRASLQDGTHSISVCLHRFFPREILTRIEEALAESLGDEAALHGIRLIHAADVDLMDLMAEAEMLVTDYSSLAYDMTFLGKSVAMYMFDISDYLAHRTTYIDLRDVFTEHVAHAPDELPETIAAVRGRLHPHYAARVLVPIDAAERARIADGEHIDDLLDAMLTRDRTRDLVGLGSDHKFWPMSQSRSGRPSMASDTAIA